MSFLVQLLERLPTQLREDCLAAPVRPALEALSSPHLPLEEDLVLGLKLVELSLVSPCLGRSSMILN